MFCCNLGSGADFGVDVRGEANDRPALGDCALAAARQSAPRVFHCQVQGESGIAIYTVRCVLIAF